MRQGHWRKYEKDEIYKRIKNTYWIIPIYYIIPRRLQVGNNNKASEACDKCIFLLIFFLYLYMLLVIAIRKIPLMNWLNLTVFLQQLYLTRFVFITLRIISFVRVAVPSAIYALA